MPGGSLNGKTGRFTYPLGIYTTDPPVASVVVSHDLPLTYFTHDESRFGVLLPRLEKTATTEEPRGFPSPSMHQGKFSLKYGTHTALVLTVSFPSVERALCFGGFLI